MARFSLGGDGDGDGDGVEEGPSNNRPLPKKHRTSNFNNGNPSSTSGGRRRIIVTSDMEMESPLFPGEDESEEEQSEGESGGSFSDPSGAAEYSIQEEEEDEEQHRNDRSGGDVQYTEAGLDSTPAENGTAHEPVVAARSEMPASICVTLTDPDVLDCPICLEPLSSPVYQCENGHLACASCCTRMRNKCGSCCWPIGYNRCRAIEKVLESIKISCRYKHHGCNELLNYNKKLDHEKTCPHTPCSCPHPYCNYVGHSKSLYTHFNLQHSLSSRKFHFHSTILLSLGNNEKPVFIQDLRENILFILNRSIEPLGSCVSVICVGPSLSNKGFKYEVKARDGESLINLKTVMESTQEWVEEVNAKRFLVVPSDFVGLDGKLKLEVVISPVSGTI